MALRPSESMLAINRQRGKKGLDVADRVSETLVRDLVSGHAIGVVTATGLEAGQPSAADELRAAILQAQCFDELSALLGRIQAAYEGEKLAQEEVEALTAVASQEAQCMPVTACVNEPEPHPKEAVDSLECYSSLTAHPKPSGKRSVTW